MKHNRKRNVDKAISNRYNSAIKMKLSENVEGTSML
jgi:hypothetical protein